MNANTITLLKNNTDNKNFYDLDWLTEFYHFLQGNIPEGISFTKGHQPKMSHKKAFSIIWYLQEHFSIFPDTIEQCSNCSGLFDKSSQGIYWESKGKFFCGGCDHLVPFNADRNRK